MSPERGLQACRALEEIPATTYSAAFEVEFSRLLVDSHIRQSLCKRRLFRTSGKSEGKEIRRPSSFATTRYETSEMSTWKFHWPMERWVHSKPISGGLSLPLRWQCTLLDCEEAVAQGGAYVLAQTAQGTFRRPHFLLFWPSSMLQEAPLLPQAAKTIKLSAFTFVT